MEFPPSGAADRHISSFEQLAPIIENPGAVDGLGPENLEAIHDDIERLPEYEGYVREPINFETLGSILADFDAGSGGLAPEEAAKERSLLAEMIENVKGSARRYYESILRQRLSEVQRMRMEPWELREHVEGLDKRRRIIHNELLSNLSILARTCAKRLPEKGVAISPEKFFPGGEITDRNRERFGDWAYRMEQGRRAKEIHDRTEELLKKKTGGAQ